MIQSIPNPEPSHILLEKPGSGKRAQTVKNQGLTHSEVLERRARGQGNSVRFSASRSYWEILRRNALTFINSVLFAISILLIVMGKLSDAFVTGGLVLLNVLLGVIQEARAKRKLEKIALLTRPKATVIRDGEEQVLDPAEIVLGDLLVARAGDQIVVDGQVVGDGRMQVDESLLTGESERVPKQPGDPVYSGSFCVAGTAVYEAQHVGAGSLVNQLTVQARRFRQIKTPVQQDVNLIIRTIIVLVTPVGILLGISFALKHTPLVEAVRMAAVIVALVPQGLFFMTTVAYALGIVRVAGRGALIQQANAVESLSHVDLLCLDKTGTLTTNSIRFDTMWLVPQNPEPDSGPAVERALADYAASTAGANRTITALQEALGGQARPVREQVPFSSELGWSAVDFDDRDRPGTYVLGAPEVVQPSLAFDPGFGPQIDDWTQAGLRVLLFAHRPDHAPLLDSQGVPHLPAELIPLSLLSFRDELRTEAHETLEHFSELGIRPKIISGDNPHTVAALARQVGLASDVHTVSGLDLAGMSPVQLAQAAEEATIFGRITPQQKEELVRLFRSQGHYVAMIGDGVNDVLSLKQAHVGISMQSGSNATRSVADVVLMGDSFAALPIAFREGQRIVKGMEDAMRLLLTRTFYVLLVVIATRLMNLDFPVTPAHNSLLALLTAGIPILAIAAWARPGVAPQRVIRSTSHFIFTAAITVATVSLGIYLYYWITTGDLEIAQTALTTTMLLCGLLLIPFVEPPTEWWTGGDVLSGDWRPTLLALGMLILYAAVVAVPWTRNFFELRVLRVWDYLLIAGVVAAWALFVRFSWRSHLLPRLFRADSG